MGTETKKDVENMILLNFRASSDAGDVRWHVKKFDDCERTLHDSRDGNLAGDSFRERTAEN